MPYCGEARACAFGEAAGVPPRKASGLRSAWISELEKFESPADLPEVVDVWAVADSAKPTTRAEARINVRRKRGKDASQFATISNPFKVDEIYKTE